MHRLGLYVAVVLAALITHANATTFTFDTNPFEGSSAPTTPGRQVVGGEAFITFNIASDVFALGQSAFGVGDQVLFVNDLAENLPADGVNVIVLQTLDSGGMGLNAGLAANLIADRITTSGPGFFVYFNSGLDLPRLVFSTDLGDPTADLKILFRMTNFLGMSEVMPTFTAANFAIIPAAVAEPHALALVLAASGLWAGLGALRRRRGGRT